MQVKILEAKVFFVAQAVGASLEYADFVVEAIGGRPSQGNESRLTGQQAEDMEQVLRIP
jgi:hypothetical protein